MKIAHLIFAFNTGGSETMLVDIANEQVNQSEIHVIIINEIYNQSLLRRFDNRVKVHFINRKEGSKNPIPILRLNFLIWWIGVDVLHCHNNNIARLLFSLFRKKSVLTVHAIGVKTKYFKYYHRLFAVSQIVCDDIYKRSKHLSSIVYNGLYNNRITKKDCYHTEVIFKIVIVSRLVHLIKGQHFVLAALHLLKKKGYDNIQLDLIGIGESELYLRELVLKYELGTQVNFLGLRDREYIYSNLKNYDLLIQPSTNEGFGLTVAEGMAAKIPVLVSNIDGPMEVIENGKAGFYFKSKDVVDLANKILYLKDNYLSSSIKEKIEYAYKRVSDLFDISITAKSYCLEYSKM